jgi:hypothetical protein
MKFIRIVIVSVIGVGVVLLIYVLSEGLAYRLYRKDIISHETFKVLYSPIFYFTDRNKRWGDLEYRYNNLWYSDGKR